MSDILKILGTGNQDNNTYPYEVSSRTPVKPSPNKTKRIKRDTETYKMNGTIAKPEQFPFVASLRSSITGKHFCSGAIISFAHVLTAAQCVCPGGTYKQNNEYLVATGRFSLGDDATKEDNSKPEKYQDILHIMQKAVIKSAILSITSPASASYGVHRTICYPHYDHNTKKHDIAVVVIHSSFHFHSADLLRKIPLIIGHPDSVGIAEGLGIIITAWHGKDDNSRKLEWTTATTLNRTTCKKKFKDDKMADNVGKWNFCTGESEKKDCNYQGDAGGPVIYNNSLLGLVSWSQCRTVAVHVGVPFYYDWIRAVTRWMH